jgi:hypothetical protein
VGIPSDVLREFYIDNKFLFSFIQKKLSFLLIQSSITKKNIAHMKRANGNIDILYFNSDGIYATEQIKSDDISAINKIEELFNEFIIDSELAICSDEHLDEDKRMELAISSYELEVEACIN